MDYYSILGCTQGATVEELKRKYQELARIHHPDKVHSQSKLEHFHLIDQAWKVLRDPEKKRIYDLQLKQDTYSTPPIYASVSLIELSENKELKVLTYPCRCGSNYTLGFHEITSDNMYVNCEECSFSLHINGKCQI